MPDPRPTILCFGEILWDFLPEGLFPGGAPFNVAYHLHRLDTNVRLVSGIGRDRLGDELHRRLDGWGIDTSLIERHRGLPTGTVIAAVSNQGDARYEIARSVAWDQIMATEDSVRAATRSDAIVFGSLAQRSRFNQNSLDRLLQVLPDNAWRVLDVNLRAPHDDLALVRGLAHKANLLKLNAEEAARLVLGADREEPGSEEALARALSHEYACPVVCVSAGARGAGLLRDDRWIWEAGHPVDVIDTVGAGDAFLARLLTHLLHQDRTEALASSCRHGEWVASQRGATPTY